MASVNTTSSWEEKAAQKRATELKKIPTEWLLPKDLDIPENVMSIPTACGILSQSELDITENFSAVSLANAVQSGLLKAKDVAVAFCKRAAIAQQLVNCLTETFFDDAIKRGEFLDDYLNKNKRPLGPLHGVPISIKDSFNYVGVASTIGYVSYLDNPLPQQNSPLVNILLELGAILYCKTNIPQTLMSADSQNNVFGRTLNPHKRSLGAGGSSGGEGALIAMRGSILGIGTDIGGSIRIPSLCCGTYGFKPSSNRVPYGGQTSPGRAGSPCFPAVAGPLASSCEDLEFLVHAVINAQPWNFDATAIAMPWQEVTSGKRVGVMIEDPDYPLHPPVKRAIDEASRKIAAAGFELVPLKHIPSIKKAVAYACTGWTLDPSGRAKEDLNKSGEPATTSVQDIQRLIAEVREPTTKGYTVDDLFDLLANVRSYQTDWLKVWTENRLDVLLCPSAETTAIPHDTFGLPPYTILWNLLEYPALIIPFGKADKTIDVDESAKQNNSRVYNAESVDGAPLSVQIVARGLHDEQLLKVGSLLNAAMKS